MDTEKVGKLIKQIRKDNHLTQKDLALKYNITYQAVSKWENGKNIPVISCTHLQWRVPDMPAYTVRNGYIPDCWGFPQG